MMFRPQLQQDMVRQREKTRSSSLRAAPISIPTHLDKYEQERGPVRRPMVGQRLLQDTKGDWRGRRPGTERKRRVGADNGAAKAATFTALEFNAGDQAGSHFN